MDAPTTQTEIKAAYRRLYTATANAMEAQKQVNTALFLMKEKEFSAIRDGATDAGKNAEQRAAILAHITEPLRALLSEREYALLDAEREQALAKIAVNELRELLRLAECWTVETYDVSPMTGKEV
jgi:hypothetical protein